ncbi:hypothetical protein [Motilimonas pumila]|uniref:Uncharacterized protein n=1 Tax=Motilimonas pumila TaxID=2303987 RepID=A0A418YCB6_9GAMM|nr:hypothetical protein [Motilimonas pumila]RJG42112.1 hypothetical protein D1Z90_15110 [Motilimonas pumila]
MLSQFSLKSPLVQVQYCKQFQRCLVAGNVLMLISLFAILGCLYVSYLQPEQFSLVQQISSHIAMILLATFIKVGYVMRGIAMNGFGLKAF